MLRSNSDEFGYAVSNVERILNIERARRLVLLRIIAVDRPNAPPLEMPDRFRMEIVYFMTPGDHPDAPALAEHEYWVRAIDAQRWLEEGVVSIVSPLAAEATADIELTEYHERWLEWLIAEGVEHMRLVREA